MDIKYKTPEEVPSSVLCARLDVLSDAVTKGKNRIEREFYMSIPARLDKDADLVLSIASQRIKDLERKLEILGCRQCVVTYTKIP